MSYELSRMQKERRALFEAEMQRRIQYLDAVVQMSNWSYYFTHLHTRQTKHIEMSLMDGTTNSDKTAEHIPKDLGEWLHKDTTVLGEPRQ